MLPAHQDMKLWRLNPLGLGFRLGSMGTVVQVVPKGTSGSTAVGSGCPPTGSA